LCNKDYDHSYIALHKMNKRATPNQFLIYKHALILFKLYNCINTTTYWINLNFQQILTSRQTNFIISPENNYKIGSNLICKRLTVLNTLKPLKWLTLSYCSFKCKYKFLWCVLFCLLLYFSINLIIPNELYVIFFEMYYCAIELTINDLLN
jgi:hypothetical protein